jgi:hypothetical protein
MRMEIYQHAHENLSARAWNFHSVRTVLNFRLGGVKFSYRRKKIFVWAEINFRIGGNFAAYRRKYKESLNTSLLGAADREGVRSDTVVLRVENRIGEGQATPVRAAVRRSRPTVTVRHEVTQTAGIRETTIFRNVKNK